MWIDVLIVASYFVIIMLAITAVAVPTFISNTKEFLNTGLLTISNRNVLNLGLALAVSWIASHIIFH
ncbi:MAG TPA: hypothetical protein VLB82_12760 [Thermodesulfobacteriota bacterium]|jgi:hypothetical protein|nr:hypothetical protein [Thermodesulfobacteriota bacterium]